MSQNLQVLERKVARSLRRDGYRGTARLMAVNCLDLLRRMMSRRTQDPCRDAFDLDWGVETAGIVEQGELEVSAGNHRYAARYQPTPPDEFHRMMACLDIRPREYTFVDFGSGKGRALLLASEYPFAAIVGVELSAQLNLIANGNIEKCGPRMRGCRNVTAVHADAALFPLPPGPLVLYFYHPFEDPVLEAVAANIRRSLAARTRHILLVYYGSARAAVLEGSGFACLSRGGNFAVYQAAAQAGARVCE